MVQAGLLHSLGKVVCSYGEPQWAVVGDTFPASCGYSDKIVFPEYLAAYPDSAVPQCQTRPGVYEEGCGLARVKLSWGHDEYQYHAVKDYLPGEARYTIRYHSRYPGHRDGQYGCLMTERPKLAAVKPCYDELVNPYFPAKIAW